MAALGRQPGARLQAVCGACRLRVRAEKVARAFELGMGLGLVKRQAEGIIALDPLTEMPGTPPTCGVFASFDEAWAEVRARLQEVGVAVPTYDWMTTPGPRARPRVGASSYTDAEARARRVAAQVNATQKANQWLNEHYVHLPGGSRGDPNRYLAVLEAVRKMGRPGEPWRMTELHAEVNRVLGRTRTLRSLSYDLVDMEALGLGRRTRRRIERGWRITEWVPSPLAWSITTREQLLEQGHVASAQKQVIILTGLSGVERAVQFLQALRAMADVGAWVPRSEVVARMQWHETLRPKTWAATVLRLERAGLITTAMTPSLGGGRGRTSLVALAPEGALLGPQAASLVLRRGTVAPQRTMPRGRPAIPAAWRANNKQALVKSEMVLGILRSLNAKGDWVPTKDVLHAWMQTPGHSKAALAYHLRSLRALGFIEWARMYHGRCGTSSSVRLTPKGTCAKVRDAVWIHPRAEGLKSAQAVMDRLHALGAGDTWVSSSELWDGWGVTMHKSTFTDAFRRLTQAGFVERERVWGQRTRGSLSRYRLTAVGRSVRTLATCVRVIHEGGARRWVQA